MNYVTGGKKARQTKKLQLVDISVENAELYYSENDDDKKRREFQSF